MWDDKVYLELTLREAEMIISMIMHSDEFENIRIEGHDINDLQVIRIVKEEQ